MKSLHAACLLAVLSIPGLADVPTTEPQPEAVEQQPPAPALWKVTYFTPNGAERVWYTEEFECLEQRSASGAPVRDRVRIETSTITKLDPMRGIQFKPYPTGGKVIVVPHLLESVSRDSVDRTK